MSEIDALSIILLQIKYSNQRQWRTKYDGKRVAVALTPFNPVTTGFKENNSDIISSRPIYPRTALVIADPHVIKVAC